jgi:hypothetical protein
MVLQLVKHKVNFDPGQLSREKPILDCKSRVHNAILPPQHPGNAL